MAFRLTLSSTSTLTLTVRLLEQKNSSALPPRQGSDFFFYIYERRDERNESGGDAPIALGRGAPARSFREYIFKFIEIEELV